MLIKDIKCMTCGKILKDQLIIDKDNIKDIECPNCGAKNMKELPCCTNSRPIVK